MSTILDQIAPIQFIEGINENEHLSDNTWPAFRYEGVAFKYIPSLSYTLNRFGIYLSMGPIEFTDIAIEVRTNYTGAPSGIILSQGVLKVSSENSGWFYVDLSPPITLIVNNSYWICLFHKNTRVAFAVSNTGQGTNACAFHGNEWAPSSSSRTWNVCLKFFGRILPIAKS
jgi:hypothetical protein